MKKKYKKILIGFIVLWLVVFAVVWGVTLFKKAPGKKMDFMGMLSRDKGQGTSDKGSELEAGAGQQEALPVRCYKVALRDFKDELPVMGTVKGSLEITLKFEVNGIIDAINFREGDLIYKEDLIATINKKDAQLKVDYSKSKLESAKVQSLAAQKKLEIHKNLYDIGGIIKAKLEEVELEVRSAELQAESAEVELRSAESELEKTNLYAPRNGVMGSRDAEVGEFVTPNDKVATLYDTMKVFVELGIVEKDIEKLALDLDVIVTVDAYQGMNFTGRVDNIFPVIEGKSRTLTLRVGIENEDAMLLPGMFARALITVAEFKNAIVVPSMSLNKSDEGGYTLFTVDENTVRSRPVEVAYVTTDYSVIASGLYEGELVVVDTPQELKDGMSVDVIEVQESGVEE
ncbi:MAG: efflux RND transporter periplasmic adaptor subunit [Candidatus Omnitrophica bacterium]|nr:efflux RND transporter periplasmic adaptor subunit [Candidatus Omnitrophota bacterium]